MTREMTRMNGESIYLVFIFIICHLISFALPKKQTFTITNPPLKVVGDVRTVRSKRDIPFGGKVHVKMPASLEARFDRGCEKVVVKHKNLGDKKRNCSSLRAVNIAYCVGFCLPQHTLNIITPSNLHRLIGKYKDKYKCVPDSYKPKNVTVYCADEGTTIKYTYDYIKTCKCRKVKLNQNPLINLIGKRKYPPKRSKRKFINETLTTR